MRTAVLAGFAGLVATALAPALAVAERDGAATAARAEAEAAPQVAEARAAGRVPVVSARDLAGRPVRAQDGEALGTVRYVLVDLDGGAVTGVAVRDEDDRDELAVLPWHALDTALIHDDELRIRTPESAFDAAPRFTRERLAELTKPTVLTTVTDYWAPLLRFSRGETGAAPQDPGAGAAPGGAAPEPPPEEDAPSAQARRGEQPVPHLLVGRSFVTTLVRPSFRFADQIEGSDVVDAQGRELAEVDEVVIDVDAGRVAYVVLARGGALGLGTAWYAVPLASLRGGARDDAPLQLAARPQLLEEEKALDASRTPMYVPRSELQELHARFDVPPYWQPAPARRSDVVSPPAGR